MPAFLVTFDTVTPESAEDGDVESRGYAHPNGGRDDLDRIAPGDVDLYAWSLRSVVRRFGKGAHDSGRWLDLDSSDEDFRTGAVTTYSLHPPKTITDSSYRRLATFFAARR